MLNYIRRRRWCQAPRSGLCVIRKKSTLGRRRVPLESARRNSHVTLLFETPRHLFLVGDDVWPVERDRVMRQWPHLVARKPALQCDCPYAARTHPEIPRHLVSEDGLNSSRRHEQACRVFVFLLLCCCWHETLAGVAETLFLHRHRRLGRSADDATYQQSSPMSRSQAISFCVTSHAMPANCLRVSLKSSDSGSP